MSRLAEANLVVAFAATLVAVVSANLWRQIAAATTWGPDAYIVAAWTTGALATAAWWPRPHARRGLAVGAVLSLSLCGLMLQYAFMPNIAGHLLAAVLFALAARDAGKGGGATGRRRTAEFLRGTASIAALSTAAFAMGWTLLEVGSGPVDAPRGRVPLYVLGSLLLAGAAALDVWRPRLWWRGVVLVVGIALWQFAPAVLQDPAGAAQALAAGASLFALLVSAPWVAVDYQASGSGLGTA